MLPLGFVQGPSREEKHKSSDCVDTVECGRGEPKPVGADHGGDSPSHEGDLVSEQDLARRELLLELCLEPLPLRFEDGPIKISDIHLDKSAPALKAQCVEEWCADEAGQEKCDLDQSEAAGFEM